MCVWYNVSVEIIRQLVGLGFLPLLVISATELSKEVPYLPSPVFGFLFLLVFSAGNLDQALYELVKTAELHRICI